MKIKTIFPAGAVSRGLNLVTDISVLACGWWLLALSVMTCFEMLGRKVFGFSLQGIDEVGAYTYAVVGSFGFGQALITRSHTRVDFLLSRFSARTQALLNVLAMISLSAIALLCLWRATHVVLDSSDMHSTAATPLSTPMWIPQSIWLFGYLLFSLVASWGALYSLKLFFKGNTKEINIAFGPQTLEEEIEAETDIHLKQTRGVAR